MPAPRVSISSFRSQRVRSLLSDDKFERLFHGRGCDVVDIYRNIGQRGFGGGDAAVDLVYFPETDEDVKLLLDEASERMICVVPFGGGSSVAMGVGAPAASSFGTGKGKFTGCVCVDLCRMNAILEIDHESRRYVSCLLPSSSLFFSLRPQSPHKRPSTFQRTRPGRVLRPQARGRAQATRADAAALSAEL